MTETYSASCTPFLVTLKNFFSEDSDLNFFPVKASSQLYPWTIQKYIAHTYTASFYHLAQLDGKWIEVKGMMHLDTDLLQFVFNCCGTKEN